MSQVINTSQGEYVFEPKVFTTGGKVIGKVVSKENLFLFKSVMEKGNVSFSLAYGTLLGAVRDSDFISHDEDTDVAILKEDEEKFLDLLFNFKAVGFEVGRYEDGLLSLVRGGEYIDIYIFKKTFLGYRKFGEIILKEKYLLDTSAYRFLGGEFQVPTNYIGYLKAHYGDTWGTPIKGNHACNPGPYLWVRNMLKKNFPPMFKIISAIKRFL